MPNLKYTNPELKELIDSLGLNLKHFALRVDKNDNLSDTNEESKIQSIYMKFKSRFDGNGDANIHFQSVVEKTLYEMAGDILRYKDSFSKRQERQKKIQMLLDLPEAELDKILKERNKG